jgi:hypothetical protein
VNLVETHDLLTLVAKYDNRRFDDATVVAWREVLADLPFDDCRSAAVRHFTESDAYLMPVHVVRGANELDRDRRRRAREAAEYREYLALEADPTRRDRSDEVRALIAELRVALPDGGPDKLRRSEWLEADRRRERAASAEPNPHYDPAVLARLTEEER